MEKLPLSKIRTPGGALGEVDRVTVEMTNQRPVSSWMEDSLADQLAFHHPIQVRLVKRHYEVVSGFRTFHVLRAVMDADSLVVVSFTDDHENNLVQSAVFELVSDTLMHSPDSLEVSGRLYRQLKNLSINLKKIYGIRLPKKFSSRNLKYLMGLNGQIITHPRKRKTEIQRIMEQR